MSKDHGAVFKPELIGAMDDALQKTVATLPEPVSSTVVQDLATSILQHAKDGNTKPDDMSRLALLELQLR